MWKILYLIVWVVMGIIGAVGLYNADIQLPAIFTWMAFIVYLVGFSSVFVQILKIEH